MTSNFSKRITALPNFGCLTSISSFNAIKRKKNFVFSLIFQALIHSIFSDSLL